MRKLFFHLFVLLAITATAANDGDGAEMPLYGSDGVPGNLPNIEAKETVANKDYDVRFHISQPTVAVFKPSAQNAARCAIIVIPGGSYASNWYGYQGTWVARKLAEAGITAFALKYRIPHDDFESNKMIAPLQDAQRAIQLVREHAADYGIDPHKIGVMGFSAGGHLASAVTVHYDTAFIANPLGTSLRPDFAVLNYPVITSQKGLAEETSLTNLIGSDRRADRAKFFSSELHVTADTPPVFLTHASDDSLVPVENSILFYKAMLAHDRPAEMHIYAKGEHGYLNGTPSTDEWLGRLYGWLRLLNFLN